MIIFFWLHSVAEYWHCHWLRCDYITRTLYFRLIVYKNAYNVTSMVAIATGWLKLQEWILLIHKILLLCFVHSCTFSPLIAASNNAAIGPSPERRRAATSKNLTSCTCPSDVISHNLQHRADGGKTICHCRWPFRSFPTIRRYRSPRQMISLLIRLIATMFLSCFIFEILTFGFKDVFAMWPRWLVGSVSVS